MNETARAQAEVAREKAELTRSLRAVGRTSERMARRIGDELKPALSAAVVVAGAAIAVGVTVALVRRGRRHGWQSPERPSALSTAAKAVGVWALRLLARRAAQEVLSRLSARDEGAPAALSAPAVAATRS
jgi:high-affinity Fe2+/Pb2+ permease